MKIKFKNFVNLSKKEAKLILKWRNSDRIRLKMINKDIISLENHFQWLESLKNRKDCKYYLFYVDNTPVGVIDLTHIEEKKSCHGGSYIGNTEYLGWGIIMGYFLAEYYYKNNPEGKIYIEVLKTNKRVYKFNKEVMKYKDLNEDDEYYYLYSDYNLFIQCKNEIETLMINPLNIEKIIFEE